MKKPIAFLLINGINAWPGQLDAWTDRAATWLNSRTVAKAQECEYFTTALTRRIHQQERAGKIAVCARYYHDAGFDVVLVGHSNGCDLIARVLALRGEPWAFGEPVRSVHLFAAAADGVDFANALSRGSVRKVHLYGGGADAALKLAGVSRRILGWAGLGYGDLGAHVEAFAAAHPADTTAVFKKPYGHSDWWKKGVNFEQSMQLVAGYEGMSYKPT